MGIFCTVSKTTGDFGEKLLNLLTILHLGLPMEFCNDSSIQKKTTDRPIPDRGKSLTICALV